MCVSESGSPEENRDSVGVTQPPTHQGCSTVSLPELAKLVSGGDVRVPSSCCTGDFNHAEAALAGVAQGLMISAPTHAAGHAIGLVFSTGVDVGGTLCSSIGKDRSLSGGF